MSLDVASLSRDSSYCTCSFFCQHERAHGWKGRDGGTTWPSSHKYSWLGLRQGAWLIGHKITPYVRMHTVTYSVTEGLNAVFIHYVDGQKMSLKISTLKLQELSTTAIPRGLFLMQLPQQ